MEILVEFIIGSFLFVLLMATILKELTFFQGVWRRFPVISHFIPAWSFFTPNPYQVDYYILYRNISHEKKEKWTQIYQFKKMRPIYAFFWNPHRSYLKGVVDVSIDLLKISNLEKDKKKIYLSTPYLHILNYVSYLADSKMDKIEFMIVTKSKQTKPEIVFVSETHPIK